MNEQHPASAASTTARPSTRHVRIAALSVAAAVLLTAGTGTGAWAATGTRTVEAAQGWRGPSDPSGWSPFRGSDGGSERSSGAAATVDSTAADADQITGVVTIDTELGYQGGAAAGTGIVLTSSGRVLTNHHVIAGATAIRVTDESTGRAYTAEVVGSDASEDVAVLQLEDASGLTPAAIATDAAAVGDDVVAVGNANGTGTLTAAEGTVTDLDQRITTQSEGSAEGETLTGLIETDADIVSGDSGGPLKDADGAVVGIDTAASSGTADITGYAIPISTALSVAERILAGDETDGVVIGAPAFLGVSPTDEQGIEGAAIAGVIAGTPAEEVGLAAGDVVTSVGGVRIDSASALSTAVAAHEPGDSVTIGWTDASGGTHTATAVLIEGPAA